jgi:molybdate transport system substrate-binding protein
MTYQYKTLLLKHIFWAMVVAIFSVGSVHAAEIKISAAASLTDALKELATDFSRKNSGSAVQFNFGSSGSLAKQVGNGAPIDMFISANTKWMDFLDRKSTRLNSSHRLTSRMPSSA